MDIILKAACSTICAVWCCPCARKHVPMQQHQLTPAYLTQALRASGVLKDRVVKVEFEQTNVGTQGAMSSVYFINLTYEEDVMLVGEKPQTLAIKWHNGKFDMRVFFKLLGVVQREVKFLELNQSQPPYKRIAAPVLYHSALDQGSQDFLIVMQDLRGMGKTGSQMLGVSLMEAKRVLLLLARLHAIYWESYLVAQSFSPMPDCKELNFISLVLRDSWPKFLKWGRARGLEGLEDTISIGEEAVNAKNKWRAGAAQPPLTLLHGDCHCENFVFLRGDYKASPEDEDTSVIALDFQLMQIGQAAFDVATFLVMSLGVEHYRAWEDELLHFYYASLEHALARQKKSVGGFSFTQFRSRFETGLVHSFLLEVVGQGTMSSKELANVDLQIKRETVFMRLISALRSHPHASVFLGTGFDSDE